MNIKGKKKNIALQAVNRVNHVLRSLLSEVLLNSLITVVILIENNASEESFI